jgi:exodeoxyribonuclease V alpha subunit
MTRNTDADTLEGTIERLFTTVPGFSAGRLATGNGHGTVAFIARQQLQDGAKVKLTGRWKEHPKFGKQFEATVVAYSLELDEAGLALWMQKHPKLKGIGKSKAALIAGHFGGEFDKIISEDPDRVAQAAKLSPESLSLLKEVWEEHRADIAFISWLAHFELSIREIEDIKERFGSEAYAILQADPYLIIREIPRFAFKRVDVIARKMGVPKNHPGRVKHGLIWCVREAAESGDTYIERDELLKRAIVLLEPDTREDKHQIEMMLNEEIFRGGGLVERSVNDPSTPERTRQVVIDANLFQHEKFLGQLLGFESQWKNPHFSDIEEDVLKDLILKSSTSLNAQQNQAALMAMQERISILSGGAGTGKTYTISTIVQIYEQQGLVVALCAPTGKAARRMEEATGHDAATIHRLLRYHPFLGWEFNENNPLPFDLVIVDEVSMVDSHLAYRLLSAINLRRTALLMVGDHHQLPPVGPGNLLRDCMVSTAVKKVVLTQVVRQAGILKLNCQEVLNGKVAPTCQPDERKFVPWQVIDQLTDATECRRYLVNGFQQIVQGWPNIDLVKDIQVLTPQKERDLGTKRLNIELQRVAQKVKWSVDVEPVPEKSRPKFYVHDKVIQVKNDYDLNVMNGTLGEIHEIEPDGTTWVDFEGEERLIEVPADRRFNIELAYALTIHKSQGSEFPYVLLVVHKSHHFMANRNLLYTGCTRAKKKLIILGDKWGIRNCASTQVTNQRKTWLSHII